MPIGSGQPRFLALADVAEVLNTSVAQVYALVRRGELPAFKLGGRGQWRVESEQLEAFIARQYSDTRVYIEHHPWGGGDAAEFADASDDTRRRDDS